MPIKIGFSRLPFRVTAFHFSGIRYNVCRFLALKNTFYFIYKRKNHGKTKTCLADTASKFAGNDLSQHQRGVIKENAIQNIITR